MINNSIFTDGLVYLNTFINNFSFLLSIVVGLIATYFVFKMALKMRGGLFGEVLKYIGFGMSFIIIGSLVMVFEIMFSLMWRQFIYTLFFALGFVMVAIGSNKLVKGF